MTHELKEQSSDNKEQAQPFKGLINEGTTCYLNSLMQTLYFIRAFRNAIYQMPTQNQINGMISQVHQSENSEQINL